jgi:hypothetical protein
VQRNIQVWARTSLEGTVVLAIKAAADLISTSWLTGSRCNKINAKQNVCSIEIP